MQEKIYNFIEESEEEYWWFKARKNIIIDTLLKNKTPNGTLKLLDIGV